MDGWPDDVVRPAFRALGCQRSLGVRTIGQNAGASEQPGFVERVPLVAGKLDAMVTERAIEAVDDHAVTVFDDVLEILDEGRVGGGGDPALEHGELHAAPVPLAHGGDLTKPARSYRILGVGYVVGDHDVHLRLRSRTAGSG